LWYGICQFISIVFFLLFYRYRAFGRGNVPVRGAVLVASNHQSFFDPVLIGLSLPRPISIMAREGLFRVPGFATLIRSLNAFPVKRGAFNREAIRRAMEVLGGEKLLLLFPEGTRTRDGRLMPPKPGIALLARKADVPVVPAVIHGAYRAWPSHRALFRLFVPIRVAFGEPLRVGKGNAKRLEEDVARSWKQMMTALDGAAEKAATPW
jgi:1-acyl-sn-glycerol-3-phosphate acyltransferase